MRYLIPIKRMFGKNRLPYYTIIAVIFLIILLAILWRPLNPVRTSYVPLTKNDSLSEAKLQTVIGRASLDRVKSPEAVPFDETSDQPDAGDDIIKDELDEALDTKTEDQYYIVEKGDTLSGILSRVGVNPADALMLTEQYKELANLRIGQRISWEVDDDNNLLKLTWYASSRNTRVYQRNGNKYIESIEKHDGVWKPYVFSGRIDESFLTDARKAGLSLNEIGVITKALQWQLDFRRLHKGDQFAVYLQREMMGDRHESSEVLAVRIRNMQKDYYAVLASTGEYYDIRGEGLAQSFLRYPLKKEARISSPFNPHRLNPVTHIISPHNGVDFAVSRGTPVLSAGDGEVIIAKYSGSAGNFIAIRHGRQYSTRYMHLDKILVRPGQRVKKGAIIGLSGNTGRSTGPHLHYEFHIDNKPVNPVTVKLPQSAGLTGKSKAAFLDLVKSIRPKLSLPSEPL